MPLQVPENLIMAYLEGELDANRAAALSKWIESSPENARYLMSLGIIERGLIQHCENRRASAIIEQEEELDSVIMKAIYEQAIQLRMKHERERQEEALAIADQSAGSWPHQVKNISRLIRVIVIPKSAFYLAIAAMVLIVTWIGFVTFTPGPTNQPTAQQDDGSVTPSPTPINRVYVARVQSSVGAQWAGTLRTKNEPLEMGSGITLYEGLVELIFADGAKVIVEGPATIIPTGRNSMHLSEGRIVAIVPESAHGFTVESKAARVIDLGTDFGVEVMDDGTVHAHVFEGLITLEPASASGATPNTTYELGAGDALSVDAAGRVQQEDSTAPQFVRADEYKARSEADRSRYARWKAYMYALGRDPDVAALFTFEQSDVARGVLANRSMAGDALNGSLGDGETFASPKWMPGRFEQTRALKFEYAGGHQMRGVVVPDHDALDLEGPVTLALWVRAENIQQFAGTLVAKRSAPAERLNFNLSFRQQRWVQWGSGVDDLGIACWTPPLLMDGLSAGSWQHLAVTADLEQLRFYINGTLVHTRDQPQEPKTNEAPLLIGCSTPNLQLPGLDGHYPFQGLISEVLIARRAFTGQEIADLYEVGKPEPPVH